MRRIVRLTERELTKVIKRTILEYGSAYDDQQREEMLDSPLENSIPTKEDLEQTLTNIFGKFSREGMSDSDMFDVIDSWAKNYLARKRRR